MKQTQRMRNAVIQGLILNTIILLIFIGVGVLILLPKVFAFGSMKTELSQTVEAYKSLQKNGVSLDELKFGLQNEKFKNDSFSQNLVKNIDESFFKETFTNTGAGDYKAYLNELKISLNDKKNSSDYVEKDTLVSQLIPVYSKNKSANVAVVNDFDFINYIENIIYSFNIVSKGEIGIGEIEELESKSSGDAEVANNNLEENIYKIPLSFDVTGKKSDVTDFIHFFEKVGAIEIKDDSFSVYKDNFITKTFSNFVPSADYNIYENQVAEITFIEFPEYPDSSNLKSSSDLITLMKNSQGLEEFSVRMSLNFYVAGVPSYIMQSGMISVVESYGVLSGEVLQASKKYSLQSNSFTSGVQIQALSTLNSLNQLLVELNTDIQNLQKSMITPGDKYSLYTESLKLQKQIDKIKSSFLSTQQILTTNK